MNDLVRPGGGVMTPAQPPEDPRVVQIARGLRQASAKFEAPYQDALEVGASIIRASVTLSHSVFSPITQEACAKRWLEVMAGHPDPGNARRECDAMLAAPPDAAATALLVAMMLDAFPNTGRQVRDGFLATLTHELLTDGYGPHIVAVATREVRRTAKFPPTIGEVLEACTVAAKNLKTRRDTLQAAEHRLREAQGVVARAIAE